MMGSFSHESIREHLKEVCVFHLPLCKPLYKFFIFSPNNLARQVLFISIFMDEDSETKD